VPTDIQHLQPADVIVGLGEQADTVLQINGAHALQPPPQGDPLGGRLGRPFVGEEKPGSEAPFSGGERRGPSAAPGLYCPKRRNRC
jgi:hypothetical protein